MTKHELVNYDTVHDAYTNFLQMFYPEKNAKGMHLWAFIGLGKAPRTSPDGWLFPPEVARRIRLLSGPHHHVVAQAMLANGFQHKKPVSK